MRTTLEYLKGLDLSLPWPTEIELSDDPLEKAWQLAGISPLGTLDHQDLLKLQRPCLTSRNHPQNGQRSTGDIPSNALW